MAQLRLEDYRRYGRQLILDGIGLPGQLKLQNASAVVVGAGGLGCPAIQYLAAAGVGTIGIIDHDVVELSNLQRQILHSQQTIGMHKAISAAQSVHRINPNINTIPITSAIESENALELLEPYDIILDCTDNAPTRYLLSDTAIALGKPLVSGAAQRFDGQLCTYNLGEDGPCYRCLFPRPPAPELTGSCEEVGILGAVTGVIGNLQALETVKIITGLHALLISQSFFADIFGTFNATVPKYQTAHPAGDLSSVWRRKQAWLYLQGIADNNPNSRISATGLKEVFDSGAAVRVIDVRPSTEFGICRLPNSINVPLAELMASPLGAGSDAGLSDIYVVCRLGNDSQLAVDALRDAGVQGVVKDLRGGLRAWSQDVDPNFPMY
ncbi:Urmylation protein [Steccherinum ochraceum]|uniref:Needs CLA4 to survive protein 3 n=1 Tax=Steccherinum ochraceum TaxID=92696 RepID=A0A4R0RGS0_9APHY|nr:Urmylation protein [Steccherinum ochraceum]